MKPDRSFEKAFSRLTGICIAGPGFLALLVLLSWLFDFWEIGTFGREYIPMAPSTACLMVLLSSALFLHHLRPAGAGIKRFALFTVVFVGTISLVLLVQSLFGWESLLERRLAPTEVRVGNIPVGRMSPLTASAFVSAALAFVLVLPPFSGRWSLRQIGAVLASAVFLFGAFIALSYGVGGPLLYGGRTVPMALVTAVSFVLLGFGLLFAAGSDTWPLYLIKTSLEPPDSKFIRGPLAIFLLLFIVIVSTGFFYIRYQFSEFRLAAQKELEVIADLKVRRIMEWHHERLGDAGIFFGSPWISESARAFLSGRPSPESKTPILSLMETVRKNLRYECILLFDQKLKVRLAVPEDFDRFGRTTEANAAQALKTGQVLISDLRYGSADPHRVKMDIFVPLILRPDPSVFPSPVGVLMFEINPHHFLLPFVQAWPRPSKTAETLLVRRQDHEVLFLNELRHRKNTALTLRFPLEPRSELPAAMAVMGREGIVEGKDYRRVPVLAALRKIPGTPWFLVAKVDQKEVFAPLMAQTWVVGLATTTALLAAALGLGLQWRRHDNQLLRKQLALEQERKQAEEEVCRLNTELEQRVVERTAQLEAANRELESFAYSVSHDLRAPLRTIDGFSLALLEDYGEKLAGPGENYLSRVRAATRRMGLLIDDLLKLSRVTRAEMVQSRVNLSLMAEAVALELKETAPERRVEWVIAPDIWAEGDERLLEVVLKNLLANAWNFTARHPRARIEFGNSEEGGRPVYFVRDDGAGFDMAYVDRLFGVFQRLHSLEEFEGTGVGLAIVQRIIHRHGGRIWAEGAVEKGATFYFTLGSPLNHEEEKDGKILAPFDRRGLRR